MGDGPRAHSRFPTTLEFHTVLLLVEELTSQQMTRSIGPVLRTCWPCRVPTILEQLALQLGCPVEQAVTAGWVLPPCRPGARLSSTCSELVSPTCCVSTSQWSAGNPGWTWGRTTHYYPDGPPANKLPPVPETVCSAGLEVWLPELGLLPAGGTVTPRRGYVRLPRPQWAPRPSDHQAQNKGGPRAGWVMGPDPTGRLGCCPTVEVR